MFSSPTEHWTHWETFKPKCPQGTPWTNEINVSSGKDQIICHLKTFSRGLHWQLRLKACGVERLTGRMEQDRCPEGVGWSRMDALEAVRALLPSTVSPLFLSSSSLSLFF